MIFFSKSLTVFLKKKNIDIKSITEYGNLGLKKKDLKQYLENDNCSIKLKD